MPLVKSLGGGLWEIRSGLGDKIARVLIAVQENNGLASWVNQEVSANTKKGLETGPQTFTQLQEVKLEKTGGAQ